MRMATCGSSDCGRTNLFGLTLAQLQQLCGTLGFPRYTARQICDWLYVKQVTDIADMTNLSMATRRRLAETAVVRHVAPGACQTSKDGTRKYLFDCDDDGDTQAVEAVFIPDADRATLCVSCQRGCKMGCRFCVTGRQGFHGQLDAGAIMSQVTGIEEHSRLTNIVFMGMGEPMDNYDSVLAATEILTAEWGLGWSPKRITVSSVGITPALQRFLDESRCHLAISLHNPFGDERMQLMPAQKAYPVAETVALLRRYDWSGQRRVSFEYIMFDGINDSRRHADGLLHLLQGLPCRINLIRFHSAPGMPFRPSPDKRIQSFQDYLNRHGGRTADNSSIITCTLRASRGEDIMAACGLLAGQRRS